MSPRHEPPRPTGTPSTAPQAAATWTAGRDAPPADFAGIRWADGTVECRWRIAHPAGSLAARTGDVGTVLFGDGVDCTNCSSACSA